MSEEPSTDVRELATRVFDMARDGDAASLAIYLDAGVPVNMTNEKGDTLVMLAAYHGHADAVAVLAARGANVDRLNDRGQAPVAGAVFKGEDAVVRVLVEAGADPLSRTPHGCRHRPDVRARGPAGPAHSALRMSSTRAFASPKIIEVFARKNSGFCTPA